MPEASNKRPTLDHRNLSFQSGQLLATCVLIVSLFCTFLFLKRLPYPDVDFDTINYHFYLGKDGYYFFPWSFSPQEFYPLGLHQFNPLIDVLGYMLYERLGYRLGTISSLLALFVLFASMAAILKKILPSRLGLLPAFVVICMFVPLMLVNQGLMQIASYMVENTYLSLLGGALLLLVSFSTAAERNSVGYLIGFSVLVGLVATKLMNLIYVLPLALLFFAEYWRKMAHKPNRLRVTIWSVCASLMLIGLLNYHYVWSWYQSGNPFYPYYNALFHSPYYPIENWPFNMGPKSLAQRLLYPYFAITNPAFLTELKDVFAEQRLIWVFLLNVTLLALFKWLHVPLTKPQVQILVFYVIAYVLWQILFGYNRYGMFVDLVGLICATGLLVRILDFHRETLLRVSILGIGIISMGFGAEAAAYNLSHDASWRPQVTWGQWLNEMTSENLWQRDTDIGALGDLAVAEVDIVLRCGNPSTAYVATIKQLKKLPLVNINRDQTKAMTTNTAWQLERDRRIVDGKRTDSKKQFYKFAAVVNKEGGPSAGRSLRQCERSIAKANMEGQRIDVKQVIEVESFVGDQSHKLVMLIGNYNPVQNKSN